MTVNQTASPPLNWSAWQLSTSLSFSLSLSFSVFLSLILGVIAFVDPEKRILQKIENKKMRTD